MLEGKDCFILEACFADSVFYTMGQPFSKANEVKVFQYLIDFCKKGLERIEGETVLLPSLCYLLSYHLIYTLTYISAHSITRKYPHTLSPTY